VGGTLPGIDALLKFHRAWAWVAIVGNGLAGVVALAAWRWSRLRSPVVWVAAGVAEAAILVQVVTGVILVSGRHGLTPPRFHMFYGFIAFVTIGIAYSYRQQLRGRLELLYGGVGLFLMGLGIRAILVVKR
jgi:hypothetical protein